MIVIFDFDKMNKTLKITSQLIIWLGVVSVKQRALGALRIEMREEFLSELGSL